MALQVIIKKVHKYNELKFVILLTEIYRYMFMPPKHMHMFIICIKNVESQWCYVKALMPSWSMTYINVIFGRWGANTTSRDLTEVENPPIRAPERVRLGRSTSRPVRDKLSLQVS